MIGSIETYDAPLRRLANASGAIVSASSTACRPSIPFPAAVEDALAATRWAASEPSRASAASGARRGRRRLGGRQPLPRSCARRLRGEVDLRLQALVYPVTDAGVNTPSYREFADRLRAHRADHAALLGRLPRTARTAPRPDASPLRDADLAGVAPAWVMTADHDVLRDEGEAYAAALERAGVAVELALLARDDPRVHPLAADRPDRARRGRRARAGAALGVAVTLMARQSGVSVKRTLDASGTASPGSVGVCPSPNPLRVPRRPGSGIRSPTWARSPPGAR